MKKMFNKRNRFQQKVDHKRQVHTIKQLSIVNNRATIKEVKQWFKIACYPLTIGIVITALCTGHIDWALTVIAVPIFKEIF